MQLLSASRWKPCNQSESVFGKLPLSHALPVACVFCPTRLVKFRVWLRRRGPICCPCCTTPSGWRWWDGMPSTKSSYLKTSTRFHIIWLNYIRVNQNSHFKYNVIISLTDDFSFSFSLSLGFWFHVQSSFASWEDGPPPRMVQCL